MGRISATSIRCCWFPSIGVLIPPAAGCSARRSSANCWYGDQYQRQPLLRYGGGVVGSTSPRLNLNFRYQGNELFTIHDPETGREYEHPEQRAARLEEEIRRLRGS